MSTERSFFDPHLPFMKPPGERWDALFNQYNTASRVGGLGALGGGTLAGLIGYLAMRKRGDGPFGAVLGSLIGAPLGFVGAGHLSYESLRDTIPPTQQELKEQDPMYRIKQLLKYRGV